MSIEVTRFQDGMRVQIERLQKALESGMDRVGWKIGVNVPEVQKALGIRHPAVGWVDARRVYASGHVLEIPATSKLHVEAEAAIRMGVELRSDASLTAARAAIAWVEPALELVDYALPTSSFDDLLAHSMFHAGAVLGGARLSAREWEALPPASPRLSVGAESWHRRDSALVPEDLAEVALFCSRYLAAFGLRLEAGDLILSGSYMPKAAPVTAGQRVRADFGPLGSVELDCAQ